MVQTNKILTVSYGTFSCTLEGFDDSFGTMKAIAEYFRDLAADDRYFGAEPPQPDADMLARIAQREISRRVEAHRDGDGFVLRAGAQAGTALNPPQDARSEAAKSEAEVQPEAVEDAAPAVAQDSAPDETPAVSDAVEASVDETPVADTTDTDADFDAGDLDALLNAAEDSQDADDDGSEDAAIAIAEDMAPGLPEMTGAALSSADSIAAKLQRIRAVVSRNETAAAAPEYSEDEHAEAFAQSPARDMAPAEDDDAQDADVMAEAEVADEIATEDDIDVTEAEAEDIPDRNLADEIVQGTAPEISEAAETEIDTPEEDPLLAFLDAQDEDEAPSVEETAQDEDESLFADSDDTDDDDDENDALANLLAEDTEIEEVASKTEHSPLRARVVKVKRSDFEAALAGGRIEAVTSEAKDEAEKATSLSEEDEADLLRELAAVEAELSSGDNADVEAADVRAVAEVEEIEDDADEDDDLVAETDAVEDDVETGEADEIEEDFDADTQVVAEADQFEDDAENDDDAQSGLTGALDTDDEIGRLLAETDTKMDDGEISMRHQEISHLRAAVAAKRADGNIGDTDDTADARYRDDLASVVRPRRPEASGGRSQRPEAAKPAPLKLVAEQRVDDAAKRGSEGPVRPRRVPMAVEMDTAGPADGQPGFAEFAASSGARELSELLEAAAAYLSFVEGLDEFSRPQLMTKVRMVDQDDFSREDGLRSFGQLLREGKIEKIKGGRFTVSERIGFKPEKRAAS